MKTKKLAILNIVLTVLLAISLTTASLAWFSLTSDAMKSLDYTTFSESVVTFELSKAEFATLVYPAKAKKGAVALGKSFKSIFEEGIVNGEDSNIDSKATIGVSRLNLAYYGNEGSSNAMTLLCTVSSTLPTGEHVDLNRDVYYIICAQGMGLTIDERFKIDPNDIPKTDYWQEEERTGKYIPYVMGADDGYYIIDTNVPHHDLLNDFGVDNYKRICSFDTSTNSFSNFISDNYKNDANFQNIVKQAIGRNDSSFDFNEMTFYLRSEGGSVYGIFVEDSVGTIATSKEMNLDFLIMIWYNKVDELLDPSAALGDINISIKVDLE